MKIAAGAHEALQLQRSSEATLQLPPQHTGTREVYCSGPHWSLGATGAVVASPTLSMKDRFDQTGRPAHWSSSKG